MKARSLECRQPTPLNDGEIFRKKQKGWIDEDYLTVAKEQRPLLPNRLISAIIEIGDILYKGKLNGKN
jgi:hypothetical protein